MASHDGFANDILRMVSSSSSSSIIDPSFPYNSIYLVPSSLQVKNETAYIPRILTIGLIGHGLFEGLNNHGNVEIKRIMNEYKMIYVSRLLQRAGDLYGTVMSCTDAMLELADQVNKCYPEKFRLHPENTARVMLIDGCFILELVLRWSTPSQTKESIIESRSALNNIIHDLLLLQNQIPFFILESLYKRAVPGILGDGSLAPPSRLPIEELILNFICSPSNSHFKTFKIPSGIFFSETSVEHILGLVHGCYKPHISEPADFMINRYSATEILRAGINLKRNKNEKGYLDVCFKTPCLFSWFPNIKPIFLFPWWLAIFIYSTIFSPSTPTDSTDLPISMAAHEGQTARPSCCWLSFICQLCRRATLEIPQLCITDSTESFLRNQIAYEQFSENIPHYFTSYAFLMDTIINTKEHVEMLETSGVLKSYLGSSTHAAYIFNSFCENVVLGDKFYFFGQWKQVDTYYNLYWPSMLASLGATYFSSPWTGISVFAALVLFAFTGLQTAGTVVQTWYQ